MLYVGRSLSCGKTRVGCLTRTMQQLLCHSLSVISLKTLDNRSAMYLAPADFFFFPKLKATLKSLRFQTINDTEVNTIRRLGIIRKNAKHSKFGKNVERVVLPTEWVLWRWQAWIKLQLHYQRFCYKVLSFLNTHFFFFFRSSAAWLLGWLLALSLIHI